MSEPIDRPPTERRPPRYPSEEDVLPHSDRTAQEHWPQGPGTGRTPLTGGPGGPRVAPLGSLTTLATVFAVATTVALVPRPWLATDAVTRWRDMEAEGVSPLDSLTTYEVYDHLVLALLAGSFVVTCLWLRRARSTVDVVSPSAPQARRPGWIWGGWLVPIVSLWFPYQVVRDVLRVRWNGAGGTAVGWWWAAFLLFNLSSGVESSLTPRDEVGSEIAALPSITVVTLVTAVVACSLWIRVIRAIAADQEELLSTLR